MLYISEHDFYFENTPTSKPLHFALQGAYKKHLGNMFKRSGFAEVESYSWRKKKKRMSANVVQFMLWQTLAKRVIIHLHLNCEPQDLHMMIWLFYGCMERWCRVILKDCPAIHSNVFSTFPLSFHPIDCRTMFSVYFRQWGTVVVDVDESRLVFGFKLASAWIASSDILPFPLDYE